MKDNEISIKASHYQVLIDSLERYESIVDAIGVQVGEVDLKGNITFVNDAG